MMILGGIVFLLILVMVFFISRQNAAQRQEVKQMELDAEAAASKPQPRISDSVITPMEPTTANGDATILSAVHAIM